VHTALNAAIDKVDRQLRKHLDKAQDHNHTSTSEIEIASRESAVTDEEIEEEALKLLE
jgi:ribosome-associated translation inhibitor RaiA